MASTSTRLPIKMEYRDVQVQAAKWRATNEVSPNCSGHFYASQRCFDPQIMFFFFFWSSRYAIGDGRIARRGPLAHFWLCPLSPPKVLTDAQTTCKLWRFYRTNRHIKRANSRNSLVFSLFFFSNLTISTCFNDFFFSTSRGFLRDKYYYHIVKFLSGYQKYLQLKALPKFEHICVKCSVCI